MALEVLKVEAVGKCYQIHLRDALGDQIQATFHSSTKDIVTKQIRRGKVCILEDVG